MPLKILIAFKADKIKKWSKFITLNFYEAKNIFTTERCIF